MLESFWVRDTVWSMPAHVVEDRSGDTAMRIGSGLCVLPKSSAFEPQQRSDAPESILACHHDILSLEFVVMLAMVGCTESRPDCSVMSEDVAEVSSHN